MRGRTAPYMGTKKTDVSDGSLFEKSDAKTSEK